MNTERCLWVAVKTGQILEENTILTLTQINDYKCIVVLFMANDRPLNSQHNYLEKKPLPFRPPVLTQ